jgi:hypothetical protein
VSFLDGTASLGTAVLAAAGTATFSSASLAAGAHSLTAQYSGDSIVSASTSTAVSLTVTAAAADFSVAVSPASATVSSGATATTTITLTPGNGFSQTVALTCSGLPAGATCSFAPASVSVSGSAANSTLTIATAARTAFVPPRPPGLPLDDFFPGGAVLAGFGIPAAIARRRGSAAQLRQFMLLAMLLLGALALHGCGSGSSPAASGVSGGTPAGSYTVTITATAGATIHSSNFAVTVN